MNYFTKMRFRIIVLFWITVSYIMDVEAFYPNSLVPFLSNGDYTHESITEHGISQVLQELWNQSSNSFSKQNIRESVVKDTLHEIMKHINELHRSQYNHPEWHFSNEKILQANEKLKHYRQFVLDLVRLPNPDYKSARKYVSFCLHLIQAFYSNTNWIELNGQAIYTDLGLPGKQLLPVATADMETCRDCSTEEDVDGCADNLIDNGMILTSGYRSGHDSFNKTAVSMESEYGKCQHGGPHGTSADGMTVKGGINKECSDPRHSPHYRLHESAALAAIEHSRYFFSSKESGLLKEIGFRRLEILLGAVREQTLIFIIDTSPQMKPEIESLKSIIQTTTKDQSSSHTIYKFMLVTVGNEVGSITIQNYVTIFGMLKAVDNIALESRQDCQKPILQTIEKVSKVAPQSSLVFVFTDSSPIEKTYNNKEIEMKKLVINFYLTGSCERPVMTFRQKISHLYHKDTRQRRSTFTVPISFTQIAGTSGGQIFTGAGSLNLLNIGSSLDPEVTIVKLDFPGGFGGFSTLSIPVDATVTKLIINVDGITTLPTSRVKDQNGNLLYAGASGQANITESDHGTVSVMEIVNPTPGLYFLEKNVNAYWKVDVRAVSQLDFTAQLMKADANSYALTEIEGRPLVGDNITVMITVSQPDNVTSVSDLVLLDDKGVTLANSKLQTYLGQKKGVYYCNVIVPSENFQIAIDGYDGLATQFRRLHSNLISPVLIKLEILPFPYPLYTGRNFIIQYTVTNLGAGLVEILTTIKDSQQFGVSPFNRTHQLVAGANVTDMFVLHGGPNAGITTSVTVTAEPLTSGNSNFQYSIFSLTTEDPSNKTPDTTPPACNITQVTGNCNAVTQCDCNMTKVTTELEIYDIGEGLKTISYGGTAGTAVNFTHDSFIAGLVLSQGTVKAKLEADCCRVSEDITLTDWKSTSQCTVTVNPSWTSGPCTTTPPPTTTSNPTTTNSITTDLSTTSTVIKNSQTTAGKTGSSASSGISGATSSQQGTTKAGQQPGSTTKSTTVKGSSSSTSSTTTLGSSNSSDESDTGLSTTWKIVIATLATGVSVAAIFTGGILLRKMFTKPVSPD